MSNQTASAVAAIANAVNWERKGLDLQLVIEAANQGRLGESLTDWLTSRGWIKPAPVAEPKTITFTLEVKKIHEGADFLEGSDFMEKARALPSAMNGSKKTFEYYSEPEHWAEMNIPEDINVIVFADTEFVSGGGRFVRYLFRYGAGWYRHYTCVGAGFFSDCGVAVLASPLG